MSNVIQLPLKEDKAKKQQYRYFCNVCNRDLFRIKDSCVITCFNCGLPIKNLEVREKT